MIKKSNSQHGLTNINPLTEGFFNINYYLRWVIGTALLSAVTLKLVSSNPLIEFPVWGRDWKVNQIGLIWELILGIWLLFGPNNFTLWLATITTFILFSIISGTAAFKGEIICGCFGFLKIPPKAILIFDLFIVLILMLFGPKLENYKLFFKKASPNIAKLAGAFILFLFCFWSFEISGLHNSFLISFLNQPIILNQEESNLGSLIAGEIVPHAVQIQNKGNSPISIIGGTSLCGIQICDLPCVIPPGGKEAVGILIQVPHKIDSSVISGLQFWTNNMDQPKVNHRVRFRIVKGE
jgi:hypothetical protein